MVHRHPGDGGVTAMREHAASSPGGGDLWGLVSRNLLIGGQPGSGKSVPLILTAAHAALTDEQADLTPARPGQER